MDAAAWGLLGTLTGALASIATTWLASRLSNKQELARSREERTERARAFQRQTLLDLQDAIHDTLRLIVQANAEDVQACRQGNEWGKNRLSESVNEGARVALRRTWILVERVADDQLRLNIKDMMEGASGVLLSANEEAARFGLDSLMTQTGVIMEDIGRVLRLHY